MVKRERKTQLPKTQWRSLEPQGETKVQLHDAINAFVWQVAFNLANRDSDKPFWKLKQHHFDEAHAEINSMPNSTLLQALSKISQEGSSS